MTPYFILGLPRSRLAWLANAMTHGNSACLFEATLGSASIDDLAVKLLSTASHAPGNADCANALILGRLLERWPPARLVVVTRDTDAVAKSLRRLGVEPDQRLDDIRRGLEDASLLDQTLVVPFQDVGIPEVGFAIWQHCTGWNVDFDFRRWSMLDELNIQVRPEVEDRKATEHAQAMAKLLGGRGT